MADGVDDNFLENVEVLSDGEAAFSVDEDTATAVTKFENFEFTDNLSVMRIVRMFLTIEILGLVIDNPLIELPLLFRIFCRGPLFYAIRFYSRPFIDVVYLIQYFLISIENSIKSSVPSNPQDSNVQLTSRRLFGSPYKTYTDGSRPAPQYGMTVDFTDVRNWHAIKHFSHFWLGIFFVVMSVLFTLKFWEIRDYTDREEVRVWLHRYVGDGWWRRGGLNIAISTTKGGIVLVLFFYMVFVISRQFSFDAAPELRMVGGAVMTLVSVVGVIYLIGYNCIRSVEKTFVRYVSQNVAYSSGLILKKVLKSKVEIGLSLMLLLFMPVCYNLIQSVFLVEDWNNIYALPWRVRANHYVPCYLWAFPPLKVDAIPTSTCPVAYTVDTQSSLAQKTLYSDRNIVSCDTYFGVLMFTVGLTAFVLTIVLYYFTFASIIYQLSIELNASKWTEVVRSVSTIMEDDVAHFDLEFSLWDRTREYLRVEYKNLQKALKGNIFVAVDGVLFVIIDIINMVTYPVKCILPPFVFCGSRLLVLCCNSYSTEGRARANMAKELEMMTPEERQKAVSDHRFTDHNNNIDQHDTNAALDHQRHHNKNSHRGGGASSHDPLDFLRNLSSKISNFVNDKKSEGGGEEEEEEQETSSVHSYVETDESYSMSKSAFVFTCKLLYKIFCVRPITRAVRKRLRRLNHTKTVLRVKKNSRMIYDMLKESIGYAKDVQVGVVSRVSMAIVPDRWRTDLMLPAKYAAICRLRNRINDEMRKARKEFVTDHALMITVLDSTADSAGMFLLVAPYSWQRIYWTLLVISEWLILAASAAVLNYYYSWLVRIAVLLGIQVFFFAITYMYNPFTEPLDLFLDFVGRLVVCAISVGFILCSLTPAPINFQHHDIPLYNPQAAFNFLKTVNFGNGALYFIIDLTMVGMFYGYIVYLLRLVGFFAYFSRKFNNAIYSMHDHILTFLMIRIEELTLGFENMNTGVMLMHQWDEIIREQRRYALIPWPRTNPPNLLSFWQKLIELKWASMYNLSVRHLRSSLGFSLLHTAACSADADICRWIVHYYPELLTEEDFQRDTPISIALKECAYCVLRYGSINSGQLDDGTGYSDEAFNEVFPEVEDIRDDVFDKGEYYEEVAEPYFMNAREIEQLKKHYHWTEQPMVQRRGDTRGADGQVSFFKTNHAYLTSLQKSKAAEEPGFVTGFQTAAQKLKSKKLQDKAFNSLTVHKDEEKKKREVKGAKAAAREWASLRKPRFPEDGVDEYYETGQHPAWANIGLTAPQNYQHVDPASRHLLGPDEEEAMLQDDTLDYDKRLWKAVGSSAAAIVDNRHAKIAIPYKHERMKEVLGDFDKVIRFKSMYKNQSLLATMTKNKLVGGLAITRGNAPTSYLAGHHRGTNGDDDQESLSVQEEEEESDEVMELRKEEAAAQNREISFKICKFSEIVLSEEVCRIGRTMHWDLAAYKEINKMASAVQGRLVQHLALSCDFNPPQGFARISDWAAPLPKNIFDGPLKEMDEDLKRIVDIVEVPVKAIGALVNVAGAAAAAGASAIQAVGSINVGGAVRRLKPYMARGGGRRGSAGSLAQQTNNDYNRSVSSENTGDDDKPLFNDRIIAYMAECIVGNSKTVILKDCELSVYGRVGWRAVVRALRRKYLTFIVPSVFVSPRFSAILHLDLERNELDCGDCVLIAEVLMYQDKLRYLNLSFNRIGCRGMMRMGKVLKAHTNLATVRLDHNRIGPAAGKAIGLWLKTTRCLRVLGLSHNRLGELVRYPTMISRDRIVSAAKDIFVGLKGNKGMQVFDISYNHLGPTLADVVPNACSRHGALVSLNIAGNALGPKKGAAMIFAMAGDPGGDRVTHNRIAFMEELKRDPEAQKIIAEEARRVAEEEATASQRSSRTGTPARSRATSISAPSPKKKKVPPKSSGGGKDAKAARLISMFNSLNGASKSANKTAEDADNKTDTETSGSIAPSTAPSSARTIGGTYMGRNGPCRISDLCIADNQLGVIAGHGLAQLLKANKKLTALDVSGNAIADSGGQAIAEELKRSFGVQFNLSKRRRGGLNAGDEHLERLGADDDYSKDRQADIFDGSTVEYRDEEEETKKEETTKKEDEKDTLQLDLADILDRLRGISTKTEKKKKKTECDTNLMSLNLSRNNLGPLVTSNLMAALVAPCCTITDLDLSGNPLGMFMSAKGEISSGGSLQIRPALSKCKSLTRLNLDRTQLPVEQVLATIGGVGLSKSLKELKLQNAMVDEPCCFTLSHSISRCTTLEMLDLGNTILGPKGGSVFLSKLHHTTPRLRYLDLTGGLIGPVSATPLAKVITDPACVLKTLLFAKNVLGDAGGQILARALTKNATITSLDLSGNELTPSVIRILSRAVRGIYEYGHKVADCPWKKILLNNNNGIGTKAAKVLIRAFSELRSLLHLELVDIGAGPGSAQIIAKVFKDASLSWQYVDISQNDFGRAAMNQIFWSLTVNRCIRVMLCSDNKPGPKFCTQADALPKNGICIPRMLRSNPMLRELDLSYNGLSSEAGNIIFDAVIDNFSIRKLNLRGNLFDDEIAVAVGDVIRLNDIIEDFDIGDNKMGFQCLLMIGNGLRVNHALKVLQLDLNRFSNAGQEPMQQLCKSMLLNTTLKTLLLQGNKIGHEAGLAIADMIARNRTLVKLALNNSYFYPETGEAIVTAYTHNPVLLELALSRDEIGDPAYKRLTDEFDKKRASNPSEAGAVFMEEAAGGNVDTLLTADDDEDCFSDAYKL